MTTSKTRTVKEVAGDGAPLDARRAYDQIAGEFGRWQWSKFWRFNETPIVEHWLRQVPSGRGVDVGAGRAPYAHEIRSTGHSAVTLDISWAMLRQVPPFAATMRVQASATALPLRDGSADWLLCTRVLSHISNVADAFTEFGRVLRDGASGLITDIHPGHPYSVVSVPSPAGGRVRIETYKHDLVALEQLMKRTGRFEDINIRELTAKELAVRLHFSAFEKLYGSRSTPVFYAITFRAA